jgi:tRNA-specific adenosine deaminase 1
MPVTLYVHVALPAGREVSRSVRRCSDQPPNLFCLVPMSTHEYHHYDENAPILEIHDLYKTFKYTPPHSQFTILAAFYLSHPELGSEIISVGTGTKCIPAAKLSGRGELVHDSHAEVIARRGAVRWLLEEVHRIALGTVEDLDWLVRVSPGATRFRLRDGVELHLYVSALPCKSLSTTLGSLEGC